MRIVSARSQTGPLDEDITAGDPLVPPELLECLRTSDAAAPFESALTHDELLGPPALIAGEDLGQYGELLARVRADVAPSDSLEDIWVRDIVDLVWETRRLRRLKAHLLLAARQEGLARLLTPLFDRSYQAKELAKRWAARDSDAVAEVNNILAAAGLTSEAIMAETLAARLDSIERIERMIAAIEARRNAALREIDRHRTVLAEKLKRVAQEAEFEDVPAQAAHHGLASR